MFIYVVFDTEDLVHAEADDPPRDIATALADDGIVASMCVVGEKARLWERRGRRDVIAAVGRHDVSLHSNYHSVHPTTAEYLADRGWADGVAEAVRQEGPGACDLARIFGAYPSSWGTPGNSWGPQIPAATRLLGIPSNIYSNGCLGTTGACWFAGQLCYPDGAWFPGEEDACCDDVSFEASLPLLLAQIESMARSGARCALLFGGHPTRFRFVEFWDSLNFGRGHNTPPELYRAAPRREDAAYNTGVRNVRRMAAAVREVPGVEMLSVRELNRRFAPESRPLAWSELADLADRIAASDRIGTEEPVASPSQALDVLARALLRASAGPAPSHIPLRRVLGPAALPPQLEQAMRVGHGEGEELCRELVRHVDATGTLPTALPAGHAAAGPGPLLRGLARAFAGQSRGAPFEGLALEPGAEEPEIGARLVEERVYGMLPNWTPHDPNLRLEQIALHTRLQSWTLKPALLA